LDTFSVIWIPVFQTTGAGVGVSQDSIAGNRAWKKAESEPGKEKIVYLRLHPSAFPV
jgi:hypothetical protein